MPKTWTYRPIAQRALRDKVAFREAGDRASSIAASGHPQAAALARRELELARDDPAARDRTLRNRQQVGRTALEMLGGSWAERQHAIDSARKTAGPAPVIPGRPTDQQSEYDPSLGYDPGVPAPAAPGGGGGIGGFLGDVGSALGRGAEAGLRHLGRPSGATVGALTGSSPLESIERFGEGWRDPGSFSASDVGFARHLPEGSLARRALGFGLSEAADPLNIAVAAKGAAIAAKAPRAIGALVEPIAKGGFGQRLAGELTLSTGAQAAATAATPAIEGLPEGLRAPATLGVGLLGGGAAAAGFQAAPAIARSPAARNAAAAAALAPAAMFGEVGTPPASLHGTPVRPPAISARTTGKGGEFTPDYVAKQLETLRSLREGKPPPPEPRLGAEETPADTARSADSELPESAPLPDPDLTPEREKAAIVRAYNAGEEVDHARWQELAQQIEKSTTARRASPRSDPDAIAALPPPPDDAGLAIRAAVQRGFQDRSRPPVTDLDYAMRPTTGDIVLWRGTDHIDPDAIKLGDSFMDDYYSPATLDPGTVGMDYKVWMRLKVPEGTDALTLRESRLAGTQEEVVLGRGLRYEIEGVSAGDTYLLPEHGGRVVDVTVRPKESATDAARPKEPDAAPPTPDAPVTVRAADPEPATPIAEPEPATSQAPEPEDLPTNIQLGDEPPPNVPDERSGPTAPVKKKPTALERASIRSAAVAFGEDGIDMLLATYGADFDEAFIRQQAQRGIAAATKRREQRAAQVEAGDGAEPPKRPPDEFDEAEDELGFNREPQPGSGFTGSDAEIERQKVGLIDQSVPNIVERIAQNLGEDAPRQKAATTAAGRFLRSGKSALNPSAGLSRRTHVAYSAAMATNAKVRTMTGALLHNHLRPVMRLLDEHPPEYIGPDDNPIRGTLQDIAEHPDVHPTDPHYADIHPELKAAMRDLNAQRTNLVRSVNGTYGTEWGVFDSGEGLLFMNTIEKAADYDEAIEAVSAANGGEYRRTSRSAERTFTTLWERILSDREKVAATGKGRVPEFEMDPSKSMEIWASALSHDAAIAAFRRAVEIDATAPQTRRGEAVDMPALNREQALERYQKPLLNRWYALRNEYRKVNRLMGLAQRRAVRAGEADSDFLGAEFERWSNRAVEIGKELTKAKRQIGDARLGDTEYNTYTKLYHDPRESNEINGLFAREYGGPFGKVTKVFDQIRGSVLVLDASVATIQGQLAMAFGGQSTLRAMPEAVRAVRDPDFYAAYVASKPDVVSRMQSHSGILLYQPDVEFQPLGIQKIPKLGPKVKSTNDALWRGVNLMSIEMFEQWSKRLRKLFPNEPQDALDADAAAVVRQAIPRLASGQVARGARRMANERALMTSPSFVFQPFNNIFGAARGGAAIAEEALAKLAFSRRADSEAYISLRARDRLALERLGIMASSLMGLSVLSAVLSAKENKLSIEDAVAEVIDPRSGRFGSLILGSEGSIPLGGAYRSVFKLFGAVPRDGAEWMERGVSSFLRSKVSPGLRSVADQWRGRDYFGRPIDDYFGDSAGGRTLSRLYYFGASVTPIVAAEAMLAPTTGASPKETAISTLTQLSGGNYYGRRASEEWDRRARALFGSDASALERQQMQELKDRNPGLWSDVVRQRSEEQQDYEEMRLVFEGRQQAQDVQFLGGDVTPLQWRNNMRDGIVGMRAVGETLFGEREYTDEERDKLLDKNPFSAYMATISLHENEAGDVDWQAVDGWREALTDDQRAAIDRQSGVGGTTMVRVYRDLEPLRRQYLEIPRYNLAHTKLPQARQADLGRAIDRLYAAVGSMNPQSWELTGNARKAVLLDSWSKYPTSRANAIAEEFDIPAKALIENTALRIAGGLPQTDARSDFVSANPDYLLFWGSRPLNDGQLQRLRELYRGRLRPR